MHPTIGRHRTTQKKLTTTLVGHQAKAPDLPLVLVDRNRADFGKFFWPRTEPGAPAELWSWGSFRFLGTRAYDTAAKTPNPLGERSSTRWERVLPVVTRSSTRSSLRGPWGRLESVRSPMVCLRWSGRRPSPRERVLVPPPRCSKRSSQGSPQSLGSQALRSARGWLGEEPGLRGGPVRASTPSSRAQLGSKPREKTSSRVHPRRGLGWDFKSRRARRSGPW